MNETELVFNFPEAHREWVLKSELVKEDEDGYAYDEPEEELPAELNELEAILNDEE